MLFITYEELKRDHAGMVRKIAEFMGVELTPAELAAVVEQSTFASMKAAQGKFEPALVVPWGKEGAMMRRGASGGSSELLTPDQQRRIDEHCRGELARLGCDFPYDAEYGVRVVPDADERLTAADLAFLDCDAATLRVVPKGGGRKMASKKILGLVLLVVGAVLLYFGCRPPTRRSSEARETLTGDYSDQTMLYLIGGAGRGRRRTSPCCSPVSVSRLVRAA